MRMLGRKHRHRGLDDRSPAHAGVQVAGCKRGGSGSAEAGAPFRSVQERGRLPLILRRHRPGKVERGPGHMRVNVHPTGKDDHAGGVNRAAALDLGDDPAIGDANVSEGAIDAVGGIVDFSACYAKHGFSGWPMAVSRTNCVSAVAYWPQLASSWSHAHFDG